MHRLTTVPVLALAFTLASENTTADFKSKGSPLATAAVLPLSFLQVTAGGDQSCGLTTDNQAYCWGGNGFGSVGDGTAIARLRPVAVAGGLRFRQLTAGAVHTCGLTMENRAYCWGHGQDGQLGNGTSTHSQLTPVAVAGGLTFTHITGASDHTCAVRNVLDRGQTVHLVYCWGGNFRGQLGDGTTTRRLTPVLVSGGVSFNQVSAWSEHTCAMAAGTSKVYCWGWGSEGLGNATTANRLTPFPVASAIAFRQISAGLGHNCGLVRDRTQRVFCWGGGLKGQLGNGTNTNHLTPVLVPELRFLHVTAGGEFTCGVTSTLNQAYCWGYNYWGFLGDGTTTNRALPVAVKGWLRFTAIDAGSNHTCGLTSSGRAYCWGGNFGKLGDGTTENRLTPVAVVGPE